jgi:hypothetical protein
MKKLLLFLTLISFTAFSQQDVVIRDYDKFKKKIVSIGDQEIIVRDSSSMFQKRWSSEDGRTTIESRGTDTFGRQEFLLNDRTKIFVTDTPLAEKKAYSIFGKCYRPSGQGTITSHGSSFGASRYSLRAYKNEQ